MKPVTTLFFAGIALWALKTCSSPEPITPTAKPVVASPERVAALAAEAKAFADAFATERAGHMAMMSRALSKNTEKEFAATNEQARRALGFSGIADAEYKALADKYSAAEDVFAAAKREAQAKKDRTADLARRKKEGVYIGMSKEEVLQSSWGKPTSINSTHSKYSTREQWVYRDHSRGYLYFEGGKLTTIQN